MEKKLFDSSKLPTSVGEKWGEVQAWSCKIPTRQDRSSVITVIIDGYIPTYLWMYTKVHVYIPNYSCFAYTWWTMQGAIPISILCFMIILMTGFLIQ